MRRNIKFEPHAIDEFLDWMLADQKIAARIGDLLKEIGRTPFAGIGKPEPLKGNFKGYWSRRITEEHRLLYHVTDADIIIISCKGHYE
ncbi:MAG: Txe/YoeB family addiction module toxin [Rhizobacter sp.]|nr:Txe/YoeB family addiction module toxin [Chlorobiales bacterium]